MNDQERELDLLVGELEQENRLMRARNERMMKEIDILTDALRAKSTWVGLTEEEVEACFHHVDEAGIGLFDFADAIEAKLKEKNT